MFNENWYLLLLILLLLFTDSDGMSKTESAVLIGIMCALVYCCADPCPGSSTDTT